MTRSGLTTGSRVRLTSRGVGMVTIGLTALCAGVAAGIDSVVLAGAFLVLPPLLSWSVVRFTRLDRGAAAIRVDRSIRPAPATVAEPVDVRVRLTPRRITARSSSRLHGVGLAEDIPVALRSGAPLRARIKASYGQVELAYSLRPAMRGRWPVGPVVAHRVDLFGVVRARSVLGEPVELPVWPALLPALGARGTGITGLDPTRTGASDPSDEDTSLRVYQPGDDLRRVHWASAARHSQLMVRASEGSSLAPVSVLLDPPTERVGDDGRPATTSIETELMEWSVSVAASIAVQLLESGHPVRLLSTSRGLEQPGMSGESGLGAPVWVRPRDDDARAALLDQTIDLAPAAATVEAAERRLAVTHALTQEGRQGEVLVCVLVAPEPRALDAVVAPLRELGGPGSLRVALVTSGRAPDDGEEPADASAGCVADLARSGWRAVSLEVGADLGAAWESATRSGR